MQSQGHASDFIGKQAVATTDDRWKGGSLTHCDFIDSHVL